MSVSDNNKDELPFLNAEEVNDYDVVLNHTRRQMKLGQQVWNKDFRGDRRTITKQQAKELIQRFEQTRRVQNQNGAIATVTPKVLIRMKNAPYYQRATTHNVIKNVQGHRARPRRNQLEEINDSKTLSTTASSDVNVTGSLEHDAGQLQSQISHQRSDQEKAILMQEDTEKPANDDNTDDISSRQNSSRLDQFKKYGTTTGIMSKKKPVGAAAAGVAAATTATVATKKRKITSHGTKCFSDDHSTRNSRKLRDKIQMYYGLLHTLEGGGINDECRYEAQQFRKVLDALSALPLTNEIPIANKPGIVYCGHYAIEHAIEIMWDALWIMYLDHDHGKDDCTTSTYMESNASSSQSSSTRGSKESSASYIFRNWSNREPCANETPGNGRGSATSGISSDVGIDQMDRNLPDGIFRNEDMADPREASLSYLPSSSCKASTSTLSTPTNGEAPQRPPKRATTSGVVHRNVSSPSYAQQSVANSSISSNDLSSRIDGDEISILVEGEYGCDSPLMMMDG